MNAKVGDRLQSGYENNYNVLVPKLAGCDFAEAAARLGFKPPENGTVNAHLLGREYAIRSDGVSACDGKPSSATSRSILIHYITSKGNGEPEGTFYLPHHFLPSHFLAGRTGHSVFAGDDRVLSKAIGEMENSLERIRNAMGIFGAAYQGEVRNGEHMWEFNVLPKIPMQVIYHEADDEFPCDIKVKFDGGAGRFIEFETLAFLCGSFNHELVKRCKTR